MSSMSPRTAPPQPCSEPSCSQPAAFRTRSRAAWCDAHITAILHRGGLEPLESFVKPTAWRLTRCLVCGCEAHYRLEYTVEKNASGEATCRACYWKGWAQDSRDLKGAYANLAPISFAEAREHADKHGYDYIGPLTDPSLEDDPHHVRCRFCERLSADRMGDIAFGCRCQTNPRRDRQTSRVSQPKAKQRDLLKDSDLPVLDWWDHGTNDAAAWETVGLRALREVSWRCPDCGLQFPKRVIDMVTTPDCPDCEPKRRAARNAEYERFKVTPVAEVPELLAAWADDEDPRTVTVAGSGSLRRFRCPQGHHPRVSPHTYLQSGCPSCRSQDTRIERILLAEVDPAAFGLGAEIASQWHPVKNGAVELATVSPGSRKARWWQDPGCGHEWQETPAQRDKGQRLRCPVCRTILDSLAYHFPELAAEWSSANPISEWQVRPTGLTPFVPTWVCAASPEHVWQVSLASRTGGSGCPECREHGKSQVELDHHAAAERAFGNAASGQSLRHDLFARRAAWLVDISVDLPHGQKLVIEYDGSYWHADKGDLDLEKSRDLLAAGHLVVRLREHPLPALPISEPGYTEFFVYSTAPDPDGTIARVKQWALGQATSGSE
ncbi:zinc-ribbon domain-containing protein [Streptomyces goshikiensis]|uniref:zinc-ribbon domain-containing protein n=1 Tax=Streptomyces goshikiensis TaxID=1942 RepID=UPI0037205102